ncbi:hypothetical protein [Shewanella surugensis]|uniref:Lysozyme n=1 Tax=Shewanella surugensis TaxID=212020 RepID=A0ABT0LBB5_9GAMM|nr:hypothetical protein [Shewanella surugensis]MCL1124963.1 hypothetical protein [Shewanella surugensis]
MKNNHNEFIKLVPSIKQPVLSNKEVLKQQLIRHEGLMCGIYLRGESQIFIGVGRNVSITGINEAEAHYLIGNDVKRLKPLLEMECSTKNEQALSLADLITNHQKVAYLFDNGITRHEALYLLENDIKRIELSLIQAWPVFSRLLYQHQAVLINMAFDVGINALLRFNGMLSALDQEAYQFAAIELAKSSWAKTVGSRAKELVSQLRQIRQF